MKKLILITIIFWIFVEFNYQLALRNARNSGGSDSDIEEKMYEYGFVIDANNPEEPTYLQKVGAVFNYQTIPEVDLPEEWMAISSNKDKPDTLTAYQQNGIIYTGFK